MGAPYEGGEMGQSQTYVTVRNAKGAEMLAHMPAGRLERAPPASSGTRAPLVMQTLLADDAAKLGAAPDPMPRWLGDAVAWLLHNLGGWFGAPKGLEFARYSIEYHYLRNWLYCQRTMGAERAARHVPRYAQDVVRRYDARGEVSARLKLSAPGVGGAGAGGGGGGGGGKQ
jgi:7-hydroxymethyl chlorophyll a reductase